MSKVANRRGWQTCTLDVLPDHKPHIQSDIFDFNHHELPFDPDMIWASPPCTYFTLLQQSVHWAFDMPFTDEARQAIAIVKRTLEIIRYFKPTVWYIENPVGRLRKQYCMKQLPRHTVTYCQYGFHYRKPTDIWTNDTFWKPRPACSPGSFCHDTMEEAVTWKPDRVKVPHQLCEEILISAEANIFTGRNHA